MVEYESVREPGKDKVEDVYANQGEDNQRHELSRDVIARPCGVWMGYRGGIGAEVVGEGVVEGDEAGPDGVEEILVGDV